MILTLFVLFLVVAIVLVVIGYAFDVVLFDLTGMVILFLLGVSLLSNGLFYVVGDNTTLVYGNEYGEANYVDFNGTSLSGGLNPFYTVSSDMYGFYDDAAGDRFGWFLLSLGSLGFVLSLFRL